MFSPLKEYIQNFETMIYDGTEDTSLIHHKQQDSELVFFFVLLQHLTETTFIPPEVATTSLFNAVARSESRGLNSVATSMHNKYMSPLGNCCAKLWKITASLGHDYEFKFLRALRLAFLFGTAAQKLVKNKGDKLYYAYAHRLLAAVILYADMVDTEYEDGCGVNGIAEITKLSKDTIYNLFWEFFDLIADADKITYDENLYYQVDEFIIRKDLLMCPRNCGKKICPYYVFKQNLGLQE
jgi:hypothetical protein